MKKALMAHGRLSLTLTLSRWEREQPLDNFLKFESRRAEFSDGFAKARRAFLPLPAGAATAAMAGEGERHEKPKTISNN